jgi:putative colanic acid biosynthesis glycosyltransferase
MPKVLQLNSVLNTGSTGRIVEQLSDFLISKKWESYVAYGRYSNSSNSKSIRIGNDLDIKLHGIQSLLFDNHGLNSSKATKLLLTEIENIKPDIIHLHNLHGYYINYEILFKYLSIANIPVVITMHDCWLLTGHCTFFSDINCIKWKKECNHCPKLKNYPKSFIIDNSKTNYNLKKKLLNAIGNVILVPVSNWLGDIVKESFLNDFKLNVIHNGVDLQSIHPVDSSKRIKTKYSINDKKILLGVATTWDARKGIHDYYKLAELISEDFAIVLVGLSKKQIKNLPENIFGIERTENVYELNELYSAAEIVLNLSYQESFGMTTVEGFASGTPSIVYNCTASPELITSETGLIVEAGNIQQLLDAIEIISKLGKSHYSSNCRKLAETKFDKNNIYDEYFKLYQSLLNNLSIN